MDQLPSRYTLVTGTGAAAAQLMAFDEALTAAGVAQFNLVRVSSILPAGAAAAPQVELPSGSLLPIAYGRADSQMSGQRVTAGVGIGLPVDPKQIGVIVECHGHMSEAAARQLLGEMLDDAFRRRGKAMHRREVQVASTHVGSGAASAFAGVALWTPQHEG